MGHAFGHPPEAAQAGRLGQAGRLTAGRGTLPRLGAFRQNAVHGHRLGQPVPRAAPHGLHGLAHIRRAGKHDHVQVGMALTQELEQSHAVHARQAHIQKDKIPLALRHHNQGGLRIKSHPGLYAAQIQAFGQGPDKSRFIIHQQYAHGPYLRAEYA